MKHFSLRHVFRVAVLTGLGAVGVSIWQDGPFMDHDEGTQSTRLEMKGDPKPIAGERGKWMTRQDSVLAMADSVRVKFDGWVNSFNSLKGASLLEKAQQVQKRVNRHLWYVSDSAQYPRDEYWASPVQTFLSRKGDCEDYAILKFHILKHLGVPESRLYIAIVSSTGKGDVDHATLVIDTSAANDFTNCLLLNNRSDDLVQIFGEEPYTLFNLVNDHETVNARRTDLGSLTLTAQQEKKPVGVARLFPLASFKK